MSWLASCPHSQVLCAHSLWTKWPSRSRSLGKASSLARDQGSLGLCLGLFPFQIAHGISASSCWLYQRWAIAVLSEALCWESWLFLCYTLWLRPGFQRVKNSRLVMVMENLAWLGPKEFVGSVPQLAMLRNPVGSHLFPVSTHGDLGWWFPVSYWNHNKRHWSYLNLFIWDVQKEIWDTYYLK